MTEETVGWIIEITEDGGVTIASSLPRLDVALMRKYDKVTIRFHDGRKISPDQRRLIYALIHEIGEWTGYMRDDEELLKRQMKLDFIAGRMESIAYKMFSLSTVDMTTAKEFIEYLIAFIVKHGIPTRIPLYLATEEVAEYVVACLMSKRCAICGKPADLHHVDHVGMGRDRTKINHLGMKCLPLCREHHTECHSYKDGERAYIELYHLEPVKITKQIAKVYRLHTE